MRKSAVSSGVDYATLGFTEQDKAMYSGGRRRTALLDPNDLDKQEQYDLAESKPGQGSHERDHERPLDEILVF